MQENDIRHGEKICFTGGKYMGCTGWLDKAKGKTERSVYVIVLLKNSKTKHTRVLRESILPESKPTNYPEAVMRENPDIDRLMKRLTAALAQIEMDSDDTIAMAAHFHDRVLSAQRSKQEALGGRARWRRKVVFAFGKPKKRDASGMSGTPALSQVASKQKV